jgi:hypothetical protein
MRPVISRRGSMMLLRTPPRGILQEMELRVLSANSRTLELVRMTAAFTIGEDKDPCNVASCRDVRMYIIHRIQAYLNLSKRFESLGNRNKLLKSNKRANFQY